MQLLNRELGGQLKTAIDIFTDQYPKSFCISWYRDSWMWTGWII